MSALAATRHPQALKFLLEHSTLEDLRANTSWAVSFVSAMAASPAAEAQPRMIALMQEGDTYLRRAALLYFATYPSAEVEQCVLETLNELLAREGGLKSYPELWAMANVRKFAPDVQQALRNRVREFYPDAVFDPNVKDSPSLDEETLAEVIAATFRPKPVGIYRPELGIHLVVNSSAPSAEVTNRVRSVGYTVAPRTEYDIEPQICVASAHRVARNQVLVKELFHDTEWAFLVVQQADGWEVVKRERLRLICW